MLRRSRVALATLSLFAFGASQADAKPRREAPPPQQRTAADVPTHFPVGSVVIVNAERALYYVSEQGRAWRYPVAIGTSDEQWTGREVVTGMREKPRWFPISEDQEEVEPVPGGDPRNPLGARAIYLGRTLWRIHGTNAPRSIGKSVSNGCIRMLNDHVIDLFERVSIGAEVFVVQRLAEAPPRHKGRKLWG